MASGFRDLAPPNELREFVYTNCEVVVFMPSMAKIASHFGFRNPANLYRRFPNGSNDVVEDIGLEPVEHSRQIARPIEHSVPPEIIQKMVDIVGPVAIASAALEGMSVGMLEQVQRFIKHKLDTP